MDKRPIGVFDSGLGGLTAVRELRRILPGEDIVFFGDTGRVPYGSRSPRIIKEYAKQCMDFLEKQNVKMILVACGTVSSVLGKDIGSGRGVPCMGVLEPTVKAAVSATKNKNIGLIANNPDKKSMLAERNTFIGNFSEYFKGGITARENDEY